MDLWTAFLLGLVGSLHCAGMCGPLALAVPIPTRGVSRLVVGRAAYNLGRVTTYCGLGLVFGTIGRSLWLAGVQEWFSIALGTLLLIGLFVSRRRSLSPPVIALVNRVKFGMSGLLKSGSLSASAALGMLNGLLPCGLVYIACAGAAATGGIVSGFAYMAAFGAGTLPMMLAIGLTGKLIPLTWRVRWVRALPVAVFLLGTLLILRGLSLGIPYLSPDLSAASCCHR